LPARILIYLMALQIQNINKIAAAKTRLLLETDELL